MQGQGVTLAAMPILPASHPHLSQGSMCRIGGVLFEETVALIADNGHMDKLQYFGYFALLESSDMCAMMRYVFSSKVRVCFLFLLPACQLQHASAIYMCLVNIRHAFVPFCCAEGEQCQHSDMVSHDRMKLYLRT